MWLSNIRRTARDCRGFHVQVQFLHVPRVVPLQPPAASSNQPGIISSVYGGAFNILSMPITIIETSRQVVGQPNSGLVPPKGYTDGFPSVGGDEQKTPCPHCFCSPCVVQMPPDFLTGSSAPHLQNREKRYKLYRKFWRLMEHLGIWSHVPYKRKKPPMMTPGKFFLKSKKTKQ